MRFHTRKRVIGIVCTLTICGCGSSAKLDTSPGAYPAALQGSLVGACESYASTGYCECALRRLEANEPAGQLGDPTVAGAAMAKDPDLLGACRHS